METSPDIEPLTLPRPVTLEEAWTVIDLLVGMVNELRTENAALQQRVSHLEERLNLDSSNSSPSPSSNPPGKKLSKFNRNKGNHKTRGGQPGYPGASRGLVQPAKDRHLRLSSGSCLRLWWGHLRQSALSAPPHLRDT